MRLNLEGLIYIFFIAGTVGMLAGGNLIVTVLVALGLVWISKTA